MISAAEALRQLLWVLEALEAAVACAGRCCRRAHSGGGAGKA